MLEGDDDLFQVCNLLIPIEKNEWAYPHYTPIVRKNNFPCVLTVADSYWWGIYNNPINRNIFRTSKFWYYNEETYRTDSINMTPRINLNLKNEIAESNVLIIYYTSCNISRLFNGFVDELSQLYGISKKFDDDRKKRINRFIEYIKNEKIWMDEIKIRSKKSNMSADSLIYLDAVWQADHVQ